jgi:cardiolipin synthase
MRKLKTILSSKAMITAVLLLIQFALIFLIQIRFSNLFVYYYFISFGIAVLLSIRVINRKMNSGYKIAWILMLLVFPTFGPWLYVTLNGDTFKRISAKKISKIEQSVKERFGEGEYFSFDKEYGRLLSDYIRNYSFSTPVKNTCSKYFKSGEDFFESLVNDLRMAEHHIYMEYFIIRNGYMWNEIKKILAEKAKSGVDVRILVDDFGSIDGFSKKEKRSIRDAGINIKFFNPFVPIITTVLNNRDHRKICVIDTKIAYCGGVNIADEYINLDEKYGHFKDSGIAMYGEASYNFEVFFLSLWKYVSSVETEIVRPEYPQVDKGIFQPYADHPTDDEFISKNIYMNMINRAEKYVYISTPYFAVDDEILTSILNSAKSGVDVRLILPHIPDKLLVNQVAKSHYKTLISAGVKVYEYEKGFNHSKLVVVDDTMATVGSVNFDYRSFYLSYECGVWMYRTDSIPSVKEDFLDMMDKSIEITEEKAKTSFIVRIFRGILAAFSPMF